MTSDQHDLYTKFLNLKPLVSKVTEFEDAYDFLVDCHNFLYIIDIVTAITYIMDVADKKWSLLALRKPLLSLT